MAESRQKFLGGSFMNKVVYKLTKIGKTENTILSGVGYLCDGNLIIAVNSTKNKPYIRVFKYMTAQLTEFDDGAYRGYYFESFTIKVPVPNTDVVEKKEIRAEYLVWLKKLEED